LLVDGPGQQNTGADFDANAPFTVNPSRFTLGRVDDAMEDSQIGRKGRL
jgi:hypothetical protein